MMSREVERRDEKLYFYLSNTYPTKTEAEPASLISDNKDRWRLWLE
jgi:hypothetical protein